MFTIKGCSLIRGVHYERFHCTRQVTRATHVRNRVCLRVELILKIIIINFANYISRIY